MAKKPEAENDTLDHQTDADEGMGEFEEDGTADALRAMLKNDGADDDKGGLDQPFDEDDAADLDVVSPDKGQGMVEDAQLKRERATADEKKGNTKADAAEGEQADKAKTDAKPEGEADGEDGKDTKAKDGQGEDSPDLASASVADLVKDVPEAQRAELTRRLGEFEKVNALFEGREEEMRVHGLSGPSDVISRLLHLNAYAQQKPDEYIAWVARETAGDKAHEALGNAAKHLGYKLVRDDGDEDNDDPFATDRERELAAELKRIKQGQQPNDFGPMAPQAVAQHQAMQVITALKTELDPATGNPKRPYWGNVEHLIARRATEHRQSTNAAPTAQDLARFYDEAVAELSQTFGGGGNSAAQAPNGVAQPNSTNAAPAGNKSRAASKMIDGAGQGASRPPALSDDAPLEEVIRHHLSQQQ